MASARSNTHLALLFIISIVVVVIATHVGGGSAARNGDIRDACSATRHPSLCFRSLASFSNPRRTQDSRRWWARAAVSVTLAEAEEVGRYLSSLKRSGRAMRGRWTRSALSDCLECFDEAVHELHRSLGELRKLERSTFDWQMSNVETWVSAAMTDANTCLDGFRDHHVSSSSSSSKQVRLLTSKVVNVTYLASNALALVNKLAAPKGRS